MTEVYLEPCANCARRPEDTSDTGAEFDALKDKVLCHVVMDGFFAAKARMAYQEALGRNSSHEVLKALLHTSQNRSRAVEHHIDLQQKKGIVTEVQTSAALDCATAQAKGVHGTCAHFNSHTEAKEEE